MMINLTAVFTIGGGLLLIGGAVVGFFQMQTRQNMKIELLEKELCGLQIRVNEQAKLQNITEKHIVEINTKLDNIMAAINELKKERGLNK